MIVEGIQIEELKTISILELILSPCKWLLAVGN